MSRLLVQCVLEEAMRALIEGEPIGLLQAPPSNLLRKSIKPGKTHQFLNRHLQSESRRNVPSKSFTSHAAARSILPICSTVVFKLFQSAFDIMPRPPSSTPPAPSERESEATRSLSWSTRASKMCWTASSKRYMQNESQKSDQPLIKDCKHM